MRANETITISNGSLKGLRLKETGAIAWLGIPYAKPPVKELRWKAPREVESWPGVLSVQDFRHSSIQLALGVPNGSEDCLYLNIWRPDHVEENLPVFIFLHGGGNISGSGKDFQGSILARETNSIVVTMNYRLGAMGFFRHQAILTGDRLDDSGNYGLLDILHALKWIQKNITSFGGNSGNVTLAGQSAGARNALAAYLSPLGEGLFHKLYILSGGCTTATVGQGEAKANDILTALLIKSGEATNRDEALNWISTQSSDTISNYLHRQQAIHFAELIGDTGLRMTAFPHLFEDGFVIPKGGFDNLKYRTQLSIPIVLGSTVSEFSTFALSDAHFMPQVMQGQLIGNSEQRMLYEAAVQYGSEIYGAFNVEDVAEKLSTLFPKMPIFTYRFGWGLQEGVIEPSFRFLLGASHGADVPFYTDDFSIQSFFSGMYTEHNESGRKALTALIQSYLSRFLKTGNPNGEGLPGWKCWTNDSGSNEILSLDATVSNVIVQPVQKLSAKETISRLDEDERLSEEQRTWLKTHLFAGRFFWKNE
ncbi:carboxylesterase family protein [Paenibacillus paridis]|uniref:carboxylesterase family protein n=1 Tax=Paenibacillus paridis TaxID=2583376 RepID=UPI0011212A1D|nr:carboxylesterase family protein [Paenibacillus paridis]